MNVVTWISWKPFSQIKRKKKFILKLEQGQIYGVDSFWKV